MFLTTLITTIINVLASDPITHLGNGLFLLLDKGVYQLVASAFSIFIIMCQLNLSSIYNMASFIVDRVKALIIVFIIFKVGIALINYMLNPDKAMEGSKKLLINILICAALLVSNNFVFNVLNELSMMIVGKPESYHYTTLKQIANVSDEGDQGLIMRLFFGSNEDSVSIKNTDDIGNNLAFQSLCVTFPDMDNKSSCSGLKATIGDGAGGINIKKLNNINAKLDKTVDGHPGIALILGLYIVYSVVLAAIEIGVRMFKLMVLQLIAPVAIIFTASEEGVKADKFKKFVSTYTQVYISAFTRIISLLLVTVFVSKIFGQLDSILGEVKSGSNHSMWILIICIVAGYRFANELPKLIDGIFATHMGDSAGSGFGKFLSTLVAAPALGVAGLASGVATGVSTGSVGGAVVGGLSGLGSGMAAGFKGNTIAEKMKAGGEARAGTRARVTDISSAGGVVPWAYGGMLQPLKGGQDAKAAKFDREEQAYKDAITLAQNYDKAQVDNMKGIKFNADVNSSSSNAQLKSMAQAIDKTGKKDNFKGFEGAGIKFDDKDKFAASMLEYNTAYQNALAAYEADKSEANAIALRDAKTTAMSDAGDIFDAAKNVQTSSLTEEYNRQFQAVSSKLEIDGKKEALTLGDGTNGTVKTKDTIGKLETESRNVEARKQQFTSSKAYTATHRTGGNKK